MTIKGSIGSFVLCAVILMTGCMSAHTERMADVNPLGWEKRDTVIISFPNTDTVSARDISILMKLDESFRTRELDFLISVMTPDSLFFTENLPIRIYELPETKNKHAEIEIPYRINSVFKTPGDYIFKITHNNNNVRGIHAVGIAAE